VITHVALRLGDGGVYALPRPARHGNLFREYNDAPEVIEFVRSRGLVSFEGRGINLRDRLDAEQGFLADAPAHEINTVAAAVRFLTREEALVHARACGQISTIIGGTLTSEDLW
jgi:hypothetical protein